jgi:hypothetical protein
VSAQDLTLICGVFMANDRTTDLTAMDNGVDPGERSNAVPGMINRRSFGALRRKACILAGSTAFLFLLIAAFDGAVRAQTGGAQPNPMFTPEGNNLITNLRVSGFFSETAGTFLDSEAIEYSKSKNSLSAQRNWLQVDVNDDLINSEEFSDSIFLRAWGVYEPSYPFETNGNSDFYNDYGIRELWVKHSERFVNLFVGRQIVTWGESISFRVGDQINPQDTSFAFGFANLEQSRLPIWMIHPIMEIPDLGPLSSNFLETVYAPGFDLLYNHVDYPDDRFDGQDSVAGRVNILPVNSTARFAGRPDNRCDPGISICNAGGVGLAQPPFSTLLMEGFNSDVQWAIPRATFANSEVGVRLHTVVDNSELTAFYLFNHEINPVAEVGPIEAFPDPVARKLGLERVTFAYPKYQSLGVTANRPLYLPSFLEGLPFVLRTEAFYKNHKIYDTLFPAYNRALGPKSFTTASDVILWLMALDLTQAYAPWLTQTGTLNGNLEIQGTTLLSPSKYMQGAAGTLNRVYHNDINILLNVGSSWRWGSIAPSWTMIFNPNGQTWELFPSVVLTPTWTSKYFLKLQYIGVLGTNQYGLDGGLFKGKSQLVAQFQYNFDLK